MSVLYLFEQRGTSYDTCTQEHWCTLRDINPRSLDCQDCLLGMTANPQQMGTPKCAAL
jgi:hypothetical protein